MICLCGGSKVNFCEGPVRETGHYRGDGFGEIKTGKAVGLTLRSNQAGGSQLEAIVLGAWYQGSEPMLQEHKDSGSHSRW